MLNFLTSEEFGFYQELKTHIEQNGGIFSDWYAGITLDCEQRKYGHSAKDEHLWMCVCTEHDNRARKIESALHKLGCQGDDGGGDFRSKCVYVYKVQSGVTNESII
jgi:hypothetical protein